VDPIPGLDDVEKIRDHEDEEQLLSENYTSKKKHFMDQQLVCTKMWKKI
jgi:hypothetical protein